MHSPVRRPTPFVGVSRRRHPSKCERAAHALSAGCMDVQLELAAARAARSRPGSGPLQLLPSPLPDGARSRRTVRAADEQAGMREPAVSPRQTVSCAAAADTTTHMKPTQIAGSTHFAPLCSGAAGRPQIREPSPPALPALVLFGQPLPQGANPSIGLGARPARPPPMASSACRATAASRPATAWSCSRSPARLLSWNSSSRRGAPRPARRLAERAVELGTGRCARENTARRACSKATWNFAPGSKSSRPSAARAPLTPWGSSLLSRHHAAL